MLVTKTGFLLLISAPPLTGDCCADDDADWRRCCCSGGGGSDAWADADELTAWPDVEERVDLGVMIFCGERRERPLSAESGGERPFWAAGSAMMEAALCQWRSSSTARLMRRSLETR